MRRIRYAFFILISLALVVLALANRGPVELRLLPESVAVGIGFGTQSLQLPLFLVILLGVFIGLVLGFLWEYLREHKHRAALSNKETEVRRLEREIKQMKDEQGEEKDEILELLEKS